MNRPTKQVALHMLGWALFLALMAGFTRDFGHSSRSFWQPSLLLFLLFCGAIFYLHALVLVPRFYFRKNYTAYGVVILLLFTGVFFLKPFDRLIVHRLEERREMPFRRPPPGFDGEPPHHKGPDGNRVDFTGLIVLVAILSASAVPQFVRKWRTTENRALQAEAEKVAAELSFLRAQINPHFLFNTLNNIYSLAVARSERTPDAVLKLSSILRYLTDDARQDFVPLDSEVDCVRDYIALQALRLSSKVTVEFSVEGPTEGRTIAPLLFMTFIENAFKYGTSSHEPCTITVRISSDEHVVRLFCQNRRFEREKTVEREGIGIANAKKRLDYLYAGKYSLSVDTDEGLFTVDLLINA